MIQQPARQEVDTVAVDGRSSYIESTVWFQVIIHLHVDELKQKVVLQSMINGHRRFPEPKIKRTRSPWQRGLEVVL